MSQQDGAAPSEPRATPVDQLADGPGMSRIDPNDPAAPNYELVARLRGALSLREMMIQPVRTGYLGKDDPVDPKDLPPSPEELFPDVEVEQCYAPSPDGPIRCEVFRPTGAPPSLPTMMYFHGGGFMVGRSEDTEFLTRKMCVQNNLVVVSVNYRLAPEWPFPTGLDDCLAAYRWVLDRGGSLGVDSRHVVFAGDSSGSNFAAAGALRAHDAGLAPPAAVVMLGPLCDFAFERYESFNRLAPGGIVYDAAFAGFLRGAYVRHEQWSHPHVSPIHAELGGFPPTLLVVGTADPMIDSTRAFARKLEEAGNEHVELFVRDGMPHGFYFFPRLFREEEQAYAAVERFLTKHLAVEG
jgi:acetyl esterase